METEVISDVIQNLQFIATDQNNLPKLIFINFNWTKESICVTDRDSSPYLHFFIEPDSYECDKATFKQILVDNVLRFALMNTQFAITIRDEELPKNHQIIYETKSCKTFCEKVCDYTGLSRMNIFEVLMPRYEAELYFFVVPDAKRIKKIIANGSFNTAAVNTLVMEMTIVCDNVNEISFIGKVGMDGHKVLKRIVDEAFQMFKVRVEKNVYVEGEGLESNSKYVDLTGESDDQDEMDDSIFYDATTSEIMEEDEPLEFYYDNIIKGLNDGWDRQVELKKYETWTCDMILMEKFLRDVELIQSTESDVQVIESDDELQVVSVSNPSRKTLALPMIDTETTRRLYRSTMSLGMQKELPKRAEIKVPVKSKLFNDEEMQRWNKSGYANVNSKDTAGSIKDMSNLLATTSSGYKSLDTSFRIPKKIPSSPKARRSIHDSKEPKVDRQKYTEEKFYILDKCIANLLPYNSPLSSQQPASSHTPSSVSKFIDSKNSVVIDDDDGDNNNNENITSGENSHNSISNRVRKRRLLDIPKPNNLFFNNRCERKFDFNTSSFSSLSSSSRNTSKIRKT